MVSAAAATGTMASLSAEGLNAPARKREPNIVLMVADQVRWDFIGALGHNPSVQTPNLNKVVERGVAFTHALTNQPLCSPSRACMITGRYATETGEWKLPPGVELDRSLPTLATVLRSNGYTANFIGKWHLAPLDKAKGKGPGYVAPEDRAGFLDLWEGANVLGTTSHPFSGKIFTADNKEINFEKEYRADFITDRAVLFLEQPQEKPFLLFVSYQEPHQQNDEGYIAPPGYADHYPNPYVPGDLKPFPGDWEKTLSSYYGSMQRIDESVGRILKTLEDRGMLDNTIFVFTSDHGNHFRTRNSEYKRSPHDSSIRIPLVMQGPGVDRSMKIDQIVGNIHLTPTLLELAGTEIPGSMKGKSLVPLMDSPEARRAWSNEELIQISASMVGRAIRTRDWTYCVADPTLNGDRTPRSDQYTEYQMYCNASDPYQIVNLAGREEYKEQAAMLRDRLLNFIAQSGEPRPEIKPARLYP
jgi:arylsulfatase A-like enzyme